MDDLYSQRLHLNNDGPMLVETNSGQRFQIDETPDGDFVITAIIKPGWRLVVLPESANVVCLRIVAD